MKLIVGAGCFALGIAAGLAASWPSPLPPVGVVGRALVHAPPAKCNDERTLRLVRATQDVNAWHTVIGETTWLQSRKYDLSLHKPLYGEVEPGRFDTDARSYIDANVSPVCRWAINAAYVRLASALTPPKQPSF